MSSRTTILVNGTPVSQLAADDRGLHYGDGLFETIAIVDGAPRHWARHMTRLAEGCTRLDIPAPDPDTCLRDANALCAGRARAVFKLIVTRGRGGRGYRPPADPQPTRVALCSEWPDFSPRIAGEGARVRYCRMRLGRNPALAGLKHLNRLEYVLARAEWGDEFDEGLLCDDNDHVVEGTVSNLFAVRRGALYTPDLSQCGVAGIARQRIIEQAQRLGVSVHTLPMDRDAIARADELFLSNSLFGVWPVGRLADRDYAVGALTRQLAQAIADD